MDLESPLLVVQSPGTPAPVPYDSSMSGGVPKLGDLGRGRPACRVVSAKALIQEALLGLWPVPLRVDFLTPSRGLNSGRGLQLGCAG